MSDVDISALFPPVGDSLFVRAVERVSQQHALASEHRDGAPQVHDLLDALLFSGDVRSEGEIAATVEQIMATAPPHRSFKAMAYATFFYGLAIGRAMETIESEPR